MNQPQLTLEDLTEPQQQDVRKQQKEWFERYEEWLNHPFTKIRWQIAYQEMIQLGAMRLIPGQEINRELEVRYRTRKEIVDGTFDAEVYGTIIERLIGACLAENKPAKAASEALAWQDSGSGPRNQPSLSRLPDYLSRRE